MTDNLFEKRIAELSDRAFQRGYNVFSEFLNLDEISTVKGLRLPASPLLYGGYENAERCVAGFGNDIKSGDFPIICIKISPLSQKFSDNINHRDFLGALMNLGINRNTLGDIIVRENEGYLFCLESIGEYITDNLSRIKHTSVQCCIIPPDAEIALPEPEIREHIVSSLRVDAVISSVYKLSRNAAFELFRQDKVFINSRECRKGSALLRDGDVISVRGYGKFIYYETLRETKKERTVIKIGVFV